MFNKRSFLKFLAIVPFAPKVLAELRIDPKPISRFDAVTAVYAGMGEPDFCPKEQCAYYYDRGFVQSWYWFDNKWHSYDKTICH